MSARDKVILSLPSSSNFAYFLFEKQYALVDQVVVSCSFLSYQFFLLLKRLWCKLNDLSISRLSIPWIVVHGSAYQYSQVLWSYKPIVLLCVSKVLWVVSKVLLAYLDSFQFYKPLVLLSNRTRPVCRKFCMLQDYKYNSQEQCVVSPTLCRTIDTLVKTRVSQVLFNLELSIHQSRPVYRKSYRKS